MVLAPPVYTLRSMFSGTLSRLLLASLSLAGLLLSQHASAAEYRFYHPDPLGSNVVVTDRSGNVVQRTVTTPYGETRSAINGSGQSVDPSANSVRHLFTGQEQDPESGLHSFGARHYDPFIGRFMSFDPQLIGSGVSFDRLSGEAQNFNSNAYSLNRPTVLADPTGGFAQAVIPGSFCGPAAPACIGGLLVLTGVVILMTAPQNPPGTILSSGSGGQPPAPTPTPAQTPGPGDLPSSQATPRPTRNKDSSRNVFDALDNADTQATKRIPGSRSRLERMSRLALRASKVRFSRKFTETLDNSRGLDMGFIRAMATEALKSSKAVFKPAKTRLGRKRGVFNVEAPVTSTRDFETRNVTVTVRGDGVVMGVKIQGR